MSTRRAALPALRSRGRVPEGMLGAPGRWVGAVRAAVGRRLSVRWKLTLWYGLMCALTLGLLGYGMRLGLDIETQRSIDSALLTTSQHMAVTLGQIDMSRAKPTVKDSFDFYAAQVQAALYSNSYHAYNPGQFEQVQLTYPAGYPTYAGQGCLVQAYTPQPCAKYLYGGAWLNNPFTVFQVINTGRPRYVGAQQQGETLRAYLAPLQIPPRLRRYGVVGAIEVFQQQHTYTDIQNALSLILVIGIPIALLIALVVGWWIARAALRPIDRISRTVQTIGESQDLSRRVSFVGPMDEVGRLAHTFDGMMDRLEKVFDTQKRFIADASHELRTPLTAIRGNADLYRIAPPEERDICVTSIRREAERMSRLVADLLLLAAADVEEQPVHMQRVDLCEVLADVYRSALITAGDRVSVDFDPAESVVVCADPDRIKQLVLNLLDNAVKFTPDSGSILLGLQTEPGGARISVSDSGVGIPREAQEAIFERFFRVDSSRSKKGSGLGLAICAWIAQAHHGSIEVQSEPGKGSTFIVHLPYGEARPPAAAETARA